MKKKMMRINYKLTDLQNFLYLKSSLVYVDYVSVSHSLWHQGERRCPVTDICLPVTTIFIPGPLK